MNHTRTPTDAHQSAAADGPARRRPWLVALAAGTACAVCLVPGLVVGGALAGIGAAVAGWWWVAALVVVVTAGVVWHRRGGTDQPATCRCGDC